MTNRSFTVSVSEFATHNFASHLVFLSKASPSVAKRLINSYEKALKSHEEQPEHCPWLLKEYIPEMTYRFLVFGKSYMIIFKIVKQMVYVDAIADCRQGVIRSPE